MKTKEPIKYQKILSYVKRLSERDKEKLSNFLRNEKLNNLLTDLRESTKDIQLSFDEITAEVEAVRTQRYEKK